MTQKTKVEIGYYRRRDGEIVKVFDITKGHFPVRVRRLPQYRDGTIPPRDIGYLRNGHFFRSSEDPRDLVEPLKIEEYPEYYL